MRTRSTSAAELDVVNAALSYDLKRLGLGADFLEEVDRVVSEIAKAPRTYPRLQVEGLNLPDNFRFAKTKRFSFLIFFREFTEEVEIAAVKHAHNDLSALLQRFNE